jgi:hypothetical protein
LTPFDVEDHTPLAGVPDVSSFGKNDPDIFFWRPPDLDPELKKGDLRRETPNAY